MSYISRLEDWARRRRQLLFHAPSRTFDPCTLAGRYCNNQYWEYTLHTPAGNEGGDEWYICNPKTPIRVHADAYHSGLIRGEDWDNFYDWLGFHRSAKRFVRRYDMETYELGYLKHAVDVMLWSEMRRRWAGLGLDDRGWTEGELQEFAAWIDDRSRELIEGVCEVGQKRDMLRGQAFSRLIPC